MSGILGIIPAAGMGNRLAPFPCSKELFPVGYQHCNSWRVGQCPAWVPSLSRMLFWRAAM
jgi:hypothetical protein